MTDLSTGTLFASSNPAIASVSNDGELRPRSDDIATVIINNGSQQDSISVEVRNIGDLLYRDGFEAQGSFR